MGIGDGLFGAVGASLERILRKVGSTLTVIRDTGNRTLTGYLDRPLPDRDVAPRNHEYDLVIEAGVPSGAPLQGGELIQDPDGQYYLVRVLRQQPPVVVGQVWRCNAVATIYRPTEVKDAVSGITQATMTPAVTGVICRISAHPGTSSAHQEGRPVQLDGHWVTMEEYSVAAAAGVLQAGDELEAPGWPLLKVGRPALGDSDDPSWEVPAVPVLPRGQPGVEV